MGRGFVRIGRRIRVLRCRQEQEEAPCHQIRLSCQFYSGVRKVAAPWATRLTRLPNYRSWLRM